MVKEMGTKPRPRPIADLGRQRGVRGHGQVFESFISDKLKTGSK